jgi:hypothetical protein
MGDCRHGVAMSRVVGIDKSLGIHRGGTGVVILLSVRAEPGVKVESAKAPVSVVFVDSILTVQPGGQSVATPKPWTKGGPGPSSKPAA